MPAIAVVMTEPQRPLILSSRIYFGLHQAIQYNVKVKDIGSVQQDHLEPLIRNWKNVDAGYSVTPDAVHTEMPPAVSNGEEDKESESDDDVEDTDEAGDDEDDGNGEAVDTELSNTLSQTHLQEQPEYAKNGNTQISELELVANPKGFFKKGRVFMTLWTEPRGFSAESFTEMARFVVIKPNPAFSVCLRVSTYSGQATTKPGVVADSHAAVVPVGGTFTPHPQGEHLTKSPIVVKVENPAVNIDSMSRINFAKPYSVEHNIMVRNIGRVAGDSVGMIDRYFAESLGYTKP